MSVSFGQLEAILESVWETVVDLPYETDDGAVAYVAEQGAHVLATVTLAGPSGYRVSLSSSYAGAKHVASRMFRTEDRGVTLAQVCDAFGEVVNVLSGNMKTLLPGAGEMSLPAVRKATAQECIGPNAACEVRFHSAGHTFFAQLFGDAN